MRFKQGLAAGAVVCLAAGPAQADSLAGKFAFDWHSEPARVTCAKVAGALLADLQSAKFRCNPSPVSNTSSGARARVCTERKGKREFLVFDTQRACETERKTQASNE